MTRTRTQLRKALDYLFLDRAGRIAQSDIRCSAIYAWYSPAPPITRREHQQEVRSLKGITSHYDRFSRQVISDRMVGAKYAAVLEKGDMPAVAYDDRGGADGDLLTGLMPLVSLLSRPLYVGKTDADSGLSGRIRFHLNNDNSLNVKLKELLRQADPDARLTMSDFLIAYINIDEYIEDSGENVSSKDQAVKDLEKTMFHFEMPPLNTKKGN